MNTKFLAVSGIIAALYIAITMLLAPLSFGPVQFRFSEMFNHLIVFSPKYGVGVVIGVFISNWLFSSLGVADLIFGVGHTIITFCIALLIFKFVKNIWARLLINSLLFTTTMFIIAYELNLVLELPFFETWLYLAVGEFVVLAIGAPIMHTLNKRLQFQKLMK
ncbi:MAG: QueT transporter family protein [Caryophanon sp.]|nr:QueT transporter family protein [Caryophanon sp.]